MKYFTRLLLICISQIFLLQSVSAKEAQTPPSITVINSVRGNGLGHETDDLLASLKAQYSVTKDASISATWLLQYGVLENKEMVSFAQKEMQNQEFGLLFEIDRNFAEKSGVGFRGQGSWYFSDGLFLISYDKAERKKLIDTAFSKFHSLFGYYPKTVGAWWIGGDSLTYMHDRYGVIATLRAADQFNLDFYSIWGTPWNIPYLSSKNNQAIPASSFEESSKVVNLQWAIRDPLRGYADPIYSMQDHTMKGYTTDYVDYLASIFLQQPFGNFVIGLENGGTLENFEGQYKTILLKAKKLEKEGKTTISLAKDYARQYLDQKTIFASKTSLLSTDFSSKDQSFWYTSENYRAVIHKRGDQIYLMDVRNYSDKIYEDFSVLPNSQSRLRINTPSSIDSMRFQEKSTRIATSSEELSMQENKESVELVSGAKRIGVFSPKEFTLYHDVEPHVKKFEFFKRRATIPPIVIVYIVFAIYFLYLIIQKTSLWHLVLLFVPLLLASDFQQNSSITLFDKKELLILGGLSFIPWVSTYALIYLTKILPLIVLICLHSVALKTQSKYFRCALFMYYYFVTLLYSHIPYIPLNKTTYIGFGIPIVLFIVIAIVFAGFRYKKSKSIQQLSYTLLIIPMLLIAIVTTLIYSRSKYSISEFEIQAVELVRHQQNNGIYVEQIDYGVKPIYKAVKPALYNNQALWERLTHKNIETVMRPSNHILKLQNYADKFIIIPRYVGSDLSDYEINSLQLTKLFDTAQIALYQSL